MRRKLLFIVLLLVVVAWLTRSRKEDGQLAGLVAARIAQGRGEVKSADAMGEMFDEWRTSATDNGQSRVDADCERSLPVGVAIQRIHLSRRLLLHGLR